MAKITPFNEVSFWEMPLIAILRGFPFEAISPVVEAIARGGLSALEITMNTSGAADQIRRAVEVTKGSGMQIGAGTVTNVERLEKSLEAGASFVVTPNLNSEVIQLCRDAGVPFIPGAFSPTEIYHAHEQGALAAKIFPANTLGPEYIKAIKAPFPNVKLAPTGGVTVDLLPAYLDAGADAIGLGSPLFPAGAVESKDWAGIEMAAQSFSHGFSVYQMAKATQQ